MSKHTPGPWVIDEFYKPAGIYKIRAADSALCLIHSVAEHGPDPESTANARLIAAAPELLRELKEVIERFKGCCEASGSDPEYAELAVSRARGIIAKAEGEP